MASNDETAMDVDGGGSEPPSLSPDWPDNSQPTFPLRITWSCKGEAPKQYKTTLQKILQSWANKSKLSRNINVVSATEEDAHIRTAPAEDLTYLEKLFGQTLTNKEGDISVTVTEFKPPSSSPDQQEEETKSEEQSQISSSLAAEAEFKDEEEPGSCSVPVGLFWYVNQIYREEMQRIEKKNGVQIEPEVTVNFKPNQQNADLRKAHSEFINLVQRSLTESGGFVVPFKTMSPEDCSAMLNTIQKYDNKLLLTISPKEVMVCGPQHSQDTMKQCLQANQISTMNTKPSAASADKKLTVEMKINDPLAQNGLYIEKSHWCHMKNSFKEQLNGIKTKFNVDLREMSINQEKVAVRASYRSSAGNAAMENHAVRALLRLYQKTLTSPMGSKQNHDVSGPSSLKQQQHNDHQLEGAVGGLQLNGKSGYGQDNVQRSVKESENDEEARCPICLDGFTNKKQLKCKHEFCEGCLERSKASTGPICPLCKDVFGVVEGNQPAGKMTWRTDYASLPGFPGCGTLVIHYNIPSGTQTVKHPHPGRPYAGISRTAYLPDNKEGNEVLKLLKKAFDQKLIFTVGTSRTTGMDNQVTWNDIHHKTSTCGGPDRFGYPDPSYLSRVREELKANGIQ